ncbi:hypothetical protein [Comamonas sp. CMM02]|uniref:DUF7822 domain-containing protein n=1 Tax=Comamonas sp. CMM02 TaxID=2769307 RepID=UPI0017821999|nr:hypothetical protein [Comamonas sp. CMM02]MBD9402360.1 hypothetical protein [Comamonas sp. CMM02]
MANRCYLYSTNVIPGASDELDDRKMIGIAEWDYEIPIVSKLLLSGNPKTCRSSLWENPEEIALIGDYASGVKNLENFLSQIELEAAQNLIAETIEFLNRPENQNQYFVFECGEIFDMGDTPLFEQNLALLEELKNMQPEVERALQSLVPPPIEVHKSAGFFAKLFGRNSKFSVPVHDLMKSIDDLGLGNWSNILYFDFSGD